MNDSQEIDIISNSSAREEKLMVTGVEKPLLIVASCQVVWQSSMTRSNDCGIIDLLQGVLKELQTLSYS